MPYRHRHRMGKGNLSGLSVIGGYISVSRCKIVAGRLSRESPQFWQSDRPGSITPGSSGLHVTEMPLIIRNGVSRRAVTIMVLLWRMTTVLPLMGIPGDPKHAKYRNHTRGGPLTRDEDRYASDLAKAE